MFDLDIAVKAAGDLDPLPGSVSRLASVVADPDSGVQELVEVINYDQALTATVLRFANSAASSPTAPIVTVRDAVVRVGRAQLLSAALGDNVERWMRAPVPAYDLAAGDLWRNAMLCAVAAESVIRHAPVEVPPETVSAALLADVGKVVLSQCLDEETLSYLRRAESEGHQSLRLAELEILGAHHGEIGALAAQNWKLPEGIVAGIQYHHSPDECDLPVAYATSLSCTVAELITLGRRPTDDDTPIAPELLERFGLDERDMENIHGATTAKFDELTGSLAG